MLAIAAACWLVSSGNSGAASPTVPKRIDWGRDIDFMRREMPLHHKNLFHSMSRRDFDSALDALARRYPTMTDAQVALAVGQIAAMVRDAHSGVDSAPPLLRSRWLPLKFYWYSDGIAVQAAAPEFSALLGRKLLAVDGMPVQEVMHRIASVTDSSNAMTQRDFAPLRLSRPDMLAALGIAKNPESVSFSFVESASTPSTVILHPLARAADGEPAMGGVWLYPGAAPGSNWQDAAPAAPRPLWLRHEIEPYWLAELAADSVLYVQCNFVLNDKDGETFAQFFERAIRLSAARKYRRFVLDLRLNGGGDNTLLLPVLHAFIAAEHEHRLGKLYVLIGRRTQSAAQNFVNLLEVHTHAIFVGEPTGESPNHYGDPEPITLPASGITINLATLWWQDVAPGDTRDSTTPSLAIELSADDYRAGRDPVLQTATSDNTQRN